MKQLFLKILNLIFVFSFQIFSIEDVYFNEIYPLYQKYDCPNQILHGDPKLKGVCFAVLCNKSPYTLDECSTRIQRACDFSDTDCVKYALPCNFDPACIGAAKKCTTQDCLDMTIGCQNENCINAIPNCKGDKNCLNTIIQCDGKKDCIDAVVSCKGNPSCIYNSFFQLTPEQILANNIITRFSNFFSAVPRFPGDLNNMFCDKASEKINATHLSKIELNSYLNYCSNFNTSYYDPDCDLSILKDVPNDLAKLQDFADKFAKVSETVQVNIKKWADDLNNFVNLINQLGFLNKDLINTYKNLPKDQQDPNNSNFQPFSNWIQGCIINYPAGSDVGNCPSDDKIKSFLDNKGTAMEEFIKKQVQLAICDKKCTQLALDYFNATNNVQDIQAQIMTLLNTYLYDKKAFPAPTREEFAAKNLDDTPFSYKGQVFKINAVKNWTPNLISDDNQSNFITKVTNKITNCSQNLQKASDIIKNKTFDLMNKLNTDTIPSTNVPANLTATITKISTQAAANIAFNIAMIAAISNPYAIGAFMVASLLPGFDDLISNVINSIGTAWANELLDDIDLGKDISKKCNPKSANYDPKQCAFNVGEITVRAYGSLMGVTPVYQMVKSCAKDAKDCGASIVGTLENTGMKLACCLTAKKGGSAVCCQPNLDYKFATVKEDPDDDCKIGCCDDDSDTNGRKTAPIPSNPDDYQKYLKNPKCVAAMKSNLPTCKLPGKKVTDCGLPEEFVNAFKDEGEAQLNSYSNIFDTFKKGGSPGDMLKNTANLFLEVNRSLNTINNVLTEKATDMVAGICTAIAGMAGSGIDCKAEMNKYLDIAKDYVNKQIDLGLSKVGDAFKQLGEDLKPVKQFFTDFGQNAQANFEAIGQLAQNLEQKAEKIITDGIAFIFGGARVQKFPCPDKVGSIVQNLQDFKKYFNKEQYKDGFLSPLWMISSECPELWTDQYFTKPFCDAFSSSNLKRQKTDEELEDFFYNLPQNAINELPSRISLVNDFMNACHVWPYSKVPKYSPVQITLTPEQIEQLKQNIQKSIQSYFSPQSESPSSSPINKFFNI